MLNLLGAGHAYPDNVLSNGQLRELFGDKEVSGEQLGIVSRRTTLPWEYIKTTKNQSPVEAQAVASETPTDLAERAATLAVERAGISFEEIGLILGATATPLQTTPSEAQRLGARLDLKIPAYDLYCGGGDLALQLATLASWKSNKVPDYVLCVSTNTPTERVNYSKGDEGFFFGDGAAAVVVSRKNPGKYKVISSNLRTYPAVSDIIEIELYGHAGVDFSRLKEWVVPGLRAEISSILENTQLSAKGAGWIDPQIGPGLFKDIATEFGDLNFLLKDPKESTAYCMGASPFQVLSEKWNQHTAGDLVLLVCGAGMCLGHVYLGRD